MTYSFSARIPAPPDWRDAAVRDLGLPDSAVALAWLDAFLERVWATMTGRERRLVLALLWAGSTGRLHAWRVLRLSTARTLMVPRHLTPLGLALRWWATEQGLALRWWATEQGERQP
jgi:hypothetical protein